MPGKAIVLLSGGLDSTTAMAVACASHNELFPISFDYGQRHKKELESAHAVAAHYNTTLRVVKLEGLATGSSALTAGGPAVPLGRDEATMAKDIPVTYVPARNSMFLAIAMSYAEVIDAEVIFTGFNAVDYSGYPDCRQEFVDAMGVALNLGTKRGVEGSPVRLASPLVKLSKVDIIDVALRFRAPLHLSWSCYVGGEKPCGKCDSCVIRAKAFATLGREDPAL